MHAQLRAKIKLTLTFCWRNFVIKSFTMGEISGEWLFVVWIWIVVLMLIVMGIRDYQARRNLPKNPEDKRINRKLALNNLKFILGIREKADSDNPMKEKADDDGFT